MNNQPHDPESQRGLDRLTDLYREGLERPDRVEMNRGLAGVRARLAARTTRRKNWMRWSLAGAGLALAGLVVVLATSDRHPLPPVHQNPVLSYQIEGGTLLKGGYLRESDHSGIRLRFDEGSQIAFDPGARGRIRSIDQAGAHVAVDHGKAAFQVNRREGRRWLVEAGPFLVTVKGTIFTVAWDPMGERFELRLRRGQVSVSGPTSKGDIDLEGGQRLVVNLAKAETVISEDRPEGNAGDNGAPTLPVAPPPPARPSPRSPTKTAPAPVVEKRNENRWSEDFAEGRWDRILKDAESGGIETVLGQASVDDLFILADAARYRHRPDLARAALLAERRRFPDSPRTQAATFLLGRVEESREGRRTQAIGWYDEYLANTPTGPLAAEALGRKMMLTADVHGPSQARPLAEDYLRRFPGGSYARSARLLQAKAAPGTP